MIEINPKIHDRYTVEFKVGYIAKSDGGHNEFHMNTWIYIPEVLDINRHTYEKSDFYRDTRSNLRLITPQYSLHELALPSSLPYSRLHEAVKAIASTPSPQHLRQLEEAVKMYSSIVKSSIRDAITYPPTASTAKPLSGKASPDDSPREDTLMHVIDDTRHILALYRALYTIDGVKATEPWLTYVSYGDEFISNVVEQHVFRLLRTLPDGQSPLRDAIGRLLDDEERYRREAGYLSVSSDNPRHNRAFVYRAGQLKKYIESNLYLTTHKRRNTVLLEQILFSLAAGVSMVFATIVSFAFQQTYGNFTLPFFIALVVSYMFKDRIKELIRSYFAGRIGSRFYDYLVTLMAGGRKIGALKEGFDFVQSDKVSQRVNETRARRSPLVIGRGVSEHVILYRKYVHLRPRQLRRLSPYPLIGINDIVRYNLREFMRKMDNAQTPVFSHGGADRFTLVQADKVYYLNFVIQCRYDNQTEYRRYKICLSRKGIKEIITLDS